MIAALLVILCILVAYGLLEALLFRGIGMDPRILLAIRLVVVLIIVLVLVFWIIVPLIYSMPHGGRGLP